MNYRQFLAVFASTACACTALAAEPVRIDDAWVRGTVAQQRATGAFMRLRSSAPVRLVAATSPAAARTEIHEMRMEGDVMRMREIGGIDLEPGKAVQLAPGGYHLMLLDLAQPARQGERILLVLTFESRGRRFSMQVEAPVRALGQERPGLH